MCNFCILGLHMRGLDEYLGQQGEYIRRVSLSQQEHHSSLIQLIHSLSLIIINQKYPLSKIFTPFLSKLHFFN